MVFNFPPMHILGNYHCDKGLNEAFHNIGSYKDIVSHHDYSEILLEIVDIEGKPL